MTIELTSALLFLLSSLYGGSAEVSADNLVKAGLPPAVYSAQVGIRPLQMATADQPFTLEEYIREYFKDTPIMAEIAKCESRFRHTGKNGRVIRGELTPDDVGVMQVNEYFHEKSATALGFDLHTLDGNLAYAKWLYKKQGVAPWFASSKCWQKSDTLAKADTKAVLN